MSGGIAWRAAAVSVAALLSLASAPAPPAAIERLGWLAGCWERARPGALTQEQWTRPAGGTMIGMGRTVAREKTTFYEFLRIETRGDRLVYVAKIPGQAEVAFAHTEIGDGVVVFANPAHDFPQRIRYERQRDGSIVATIEGERNGKMLAERFPLARARCDGPV